MKQSRKRARFVALAAAPLDTLLPALFFLLGGAAGAALSRRSIGQFGAELGEYVAAFLAILPQRELTFRLLWRTVWAYLRGAVLTFACGFSAAGLAALPLLCAAQGALLSFSVCSFAAVLGRGRFGVLLSLFLPRLCAVLPCVFLLARASLCRARLLATHRAAGAAGWGRFLVCCVFLLLACLLELRLLPRLLSALA